MALTKNEMMDLARKSAVENGIDPAIFLGLLEQESGWNPDARSHAGAIGVAQFMPDTARRVGLKNPRDPAEAIPASARLLRDEIDSFGGNVRYGVMAYNAGRPRMQAYLKGKGKPLAKETLDYFPAIAKRAAKYSDGKIPTFAAPASLPGKPAKSRAATITGAGAQNSLAFLGGGSPIAAPKQASTPMRTPVMPDQIPVLPMGDGTLAVPGDAGEADWMGSLMGKNYDTKTQQTLVSAMPKVKRAVATLQPENLLSDGLPNELDGWLMDLINRA